MALDLEKIRRAHERIARLKSDPRDTEVLSIYGTIYAGDLISADYRTLAEAYMAEPIDGDTLAQARGWVSVFNELKRHGFDAWPDKVMYRNTIGAACAFIRELVRRAGEKF